jgi:hypothetical protein
MRTMTVSLGAWRNSAEQRTATQREVDKGAAGMLDASRSGTYRSMLLAPGTNPENILGVG